MKALEKYSEIISKLDEKQRYWIFSGILLFIFLLDYFILMNPQLAALSKINPEIDILQQDLVKTKNDIQRIDQYKKDVERLKVEVKEVRNRVKSREEVPLILERISRIANDSNVKVDQIMPNSNYQEILLEKGNKIYFALPITIEARSGYHDFGRFLNKLENDDIWLNVKEFTIVASSDEKHHVIKLTLNSIVFDEK